MGTAHAQTMAWRIPGDLFMLIESQERLPEEWAQRTAENVFSGHNAPAPQCSCPDLLGHVFLHWNYPLLPPGKCPVEGSVPSA